MNNKLIPLSPKMKELLGGGATSFFQSEIPLREAPAPQGGQDQRNLAFLPLLPASGEPNLGQADVQAERPSLQSLFDPPPLMPMQQQLTQHTQMGSPARLGGGNLQPLMGQVPILGQQLPQPASGMESAPPAGTPAVTWRKCPGPIEMPGGRVIQPDDYLKLNDFCELMPYLVEAWQALQSPQKGLAPGQPVPMAGQPVPMFGQRSISPGMPGLGVGQGPGGGGGGGFPGGGGAPGFINNTPGQSQQGPVGPPGPPGAPGVGVISDPVVKVDGDFTAAPGAFIPVPGTTLTITTTQAGTVIILAQVELNSVSGGSSQSAQLGLRLNGTDQPLARRLIHTFVGGVGEFFINQPQIFALTLPAGTHTVELLLRGLIAGEYGGVGLGISASVSANPDCPLVLVALGK